MTHAGVEAEKNIRSVIIQTKLIVSAQCRERSEVVQEMSLPELKDNNPLNLAMHSCTLFT